MLITLGLGALGTLTGRNGLAQPCLGPPALGLQSWPMQGTAGYCSATAVPAHGPADPDLRPDPPPSALLDCSCLQLPQNSENPKFGDNVIENRLGRNFGKKKKNEFRTLIIPPILLQNRNTSSCVDYFALTHAMSCLIGAVNSVDC